MGATWAGLRRCALGGGERGGREFRIRRVQQGCGVWGARPEPMGVEAGGERGKGRRAPHRVPEEASAQPPSVGGCASQGERLGPPPAAPNHTPPPSPGATPTEEPARAHRRARPAPARRAGALAHAPTVGDPPPQAGGGNVESGAPCARLYTPPPRPPTPATPPSRAAPCLLPGALRARRPPVPARPLKAQTRPLQCAAAAPGGACGGPPGGGPPPAHDMRSLEVVLHQPSGRAGPLPASSIHPPAAAPPPPCVRHPSPPCRRPCHDHR